MTHIMVYLFIANFSNFFAGKISFPIILGFLNIQPTPVINYKKTIIGAVKIGLTS